MADAPRVGQIVNHHFLWIDEQAAGQIEGRKARPCLILAVEPQQRTLPRVTVLPVTSQSPRGAAGAVAIPDDVKGRIGIDRGRPAWVVTNEANVFTWPGFDLVPQPDGGFVTGTITRGFFERIREAVRRGRMQAIDRDS